MNLKNIKKIVLMSGTEEVLGATIVKIRKRDIDIELYNVEKEYEDALLIGVNLVVKPTKNCALVTRHFRGIHEYIPSQTIICKALTVTETLAKELRVKRDDLVLASKIATKKVILKKHQKALLNKVLTIARAINYDPLDLDFIKLIISHLRNNDIFMTPLPFVIKERAELTMIKMARIAKSVESQVPKGKDPVLIVINEPLHGMGGHIAWEIAKTFRITVFLVYPSAVRKGYYTITARRHVNSPEDLRKWSETLVKYNIELYSNDAGTAAAGNIKEEDIPFLKCLMEDYYPDDSYEWGDER